MWNPIKSAPEGSDNCFLVRPKGLHKGTGKPFVPTVVYREGNEFFRVENELEPVYFGQNEPEGSPFRSELEWHELPAENPAGDPNCAHKRQKWKIDMSSGTCQDCGAHLTEMRT